MTKLGHSLAWKICLLLALGHLIDAHAPDVYARRPDEPAAPPAAETTGQEPA
jgi:hypothetical protein